MPAKITILPPFFSLKTALQLVEKNNMKGIKEIYALRTHKINYWNHRIHTLSYIFLARIQLLKIHSKSRNKRISQHQQVQVLSPRKVQVLPQENEELLKSFIHP
jgi:hypothetical protein